MGDFFNTGTCLLECKGGTFITAQMDALDLKDSLVRQIAVQKAKKQLGTRKKEKAKWTTQTHYTPQMVAN